MAWTKEEEERGRKLHDGGNGLTPQEVYFVLASDKITRLEAINAELLTALKASHDNMLYWDNEAAYVGTELHANNIAVITKAEGK